MSIFTKRMITLSVVLTGLLLAVLPVFPQSNRPYDSRLCRIRRLCGVRRACLELGGSALSSLRRKLAFARLVGCPLSPLRQKMRREIQRSLKRMYVR